MGVFLDKFTSSLKTIQSQQIIRILQKERERGNITTLEEFQTRLGELTKSLLTTRISPTLRIFEAKIDELIDSETLNFMLDRIEDDLNVAFNELDSIEEVIDRHEILVNDVVLKAIETGINEADAKIQVFEFLANTPHGFNSADFNTFKVHQNLDGDTLALSVQDPKQLENFLPSQACSVDIVGEKLLLSSSIDEEATIASVRQINDHETATSELNVEVPNNDINNIIDQKIGSFWMQSTLLSTSKKEAGVVTKLELNLGANKTINFVQIEPILINPVDLIYIGYLDSNNVVRDILTTSTTISQSVKLLFPIIATSKLYLNFRNRTGQQVEFKEKGGPPLLRGLQALSLEQTLEFITPEVEALIASPQLLDAVGLPETSLEEKRYWEYSIGFDNIRTGLTKYNSRGYYVSKANSGVAAHQIGVKVLERRPYSTTPTGDIEYTTDISPVADDKYFHGSTEYYCYKLDYDISDTLVRSEVFPILPTNQTYIRHERLVLSDRSETSLAFNDIGILQFFTFHNPQDLNSAIDPDAIRVYRNGILLESGDLNPLASSGWERWDALTITNPDQPNRMRYAIRIQKPNKNDIYTVSYKPAISTTDIAFFGASNSSFDEDSTAGLVDLTGRLNAFLGKDNIVRVKPVINGITITKSIVRLIIVMRRNSADVGLTPVLEEYSLLLGRENRLG